jgi:uncharacterized protein YkvS
MYVETKSHEVIDAVNAFKPVIASLMNVKEVVTIESAPTGEIVSQFFKNGIIHLDKKMDEALYEEGIFNEVKRRIQVMRKEAGLVESDKIALSISTEDELKGIIEKMKEKLMGDVNASKLLFEQSKEMGEYSIDGRVVRIAIKK